MALVKCQRNSPNTPIEIELDGETEDDEALNKSEKSECFFARKGTALVLPLKDAVPHAGNERRLSTESLRSTNSIQSNNSDIQLHLQSMFNLLRNEETLKMAVKLESQRPNRTRYIVIASRCCFRPVIERKNKIQRHNSMRASTTAITTATAATSSSSTTAINSTQRQLSMDSNTNNNSNQRSQQSQTNLNANILPPLPTANESTSSLSSMIISSSPTNRQQNLKSDGGDFNTSAGMDIKCHDEEEGTEESCILGIDCNEHTTIGLVVPILADTTIRLDGDGGFSVSVFNKTHIFKPVSVQAMWSALQTLHKVSQKARVNNFYPGGPSHDWLNFYERRIESEQSCLNEWNAMDSIESRRPPSPDAIRNKPTAKEETESVIKMKLKEIMMSVDLDEVTSKYIRGRLEEHLDMDLGEYKSFIDQEMLTILGQMDAPTEIFEHVYLGSEWNASNLEELQKNGVRHILNVTREIDNFFPGMFDYCNVRVYDDEKTNLLKHWDDTFRYITKAKAEGSKVLVHCKMGVSRSASVVIAYAMKAYNWEFQKALQHVKQKRNCIKPNKNFLNQLVTYRGMLDAMKNKEKLQRSKSETNLKSTKDARLLPGSEPTPLIQALNQSKTKLSGVGGGGIDHVTGIEVSTAEGNNNIKRGMVGRNVCITVCASDTSMLNTEQQRARQRGVRRSSSTSPKGSSSHVAIVSKQQSQSLENLTPERSVADEPKNVRFPGSNGENYSVTQNRVLHIQKNTPPPPPPPPPPPSTVSTSKSSGNQQLSSVRTIIHGLEGCERKTADDRKSLNLPFGRSVSHDTSDSCTAVTAKIWQPAPAVSSSKTNFDTITGSLRSSLRGFPHEAAGGGGNRSRRKTQSWAASSGGIVMDVKLGSNSSIDSASSTQSCSQTARASFYDTLPSQRRELLPRHASWGSGDNYRHHHHHHHHHRSYDTNRNATNAPPMPIFEGRTHELNMSNKTANINVTSTNTNTTTSSSSISPHYYHHHQQQQFHQQMGTVSRTKQKLEENTQFKKRRQEIDGDIGGDGSQNILRSTTATTQAVGKRNSNLYRSASTAANSARLRYPLRCNSDEIIAPHPQLAATAAAQYSPAAMRRSETTRPTPEFFSTSSTTEYSVSDIENKNLPDENIINDETEANVELRNLPTTTTTTEEQQRISGNVQILKKNFEAKAVMPNTANQQQQTTTITVSNNETHGKKGHQSLPSSPMAGQHCGDSQQQHQEQYQQQQSATATEHDTTKPINTKMKATASASNSSSNTSASSSCSSSSVSESCDRNVKGLVYQYTKYQTTTTAASTTTTTLIDTTNTNTTTTPTTTIHNTTTAAPPSLKPTRPRSYYEQNRRSEKFLTSSSNLIGKPHEFSDSRPPTGLAKVQCQQTISDRENSSQQQQHNQQPQQQQQLQHRRLQQHGKTHPLARLSLQKHNINAAAYNTILFRMFRTVSFSMENDNLKSKPTSNRGSISE